MPLSSSIGNASMSARRAMTGEPEPMVATTPVFATGCLQVVEKEKEEKVWG
jgi:hypothetical protein